MSESDMPSKPANELQAEAAKDANAELPPKPENQEREAQSTLTEAISNSEANVETEAAEAPHVGLTGQLGALPPEPAPAKRKIPILRRLSTQESQIDKVEVDEASGEIICPECGRTARVGELACANCGHVFSQSARTHKFAEKIPNASSRNHPAGEASVEQGRPIVFEVEGDKIHITLTEHLIIGRIVPGDKQNLPDVDLARFGAEERGVSRRHAKLRRQGNLVYVSDLNSTNGTMLNGRRLIPEGERLIRNNDELRLGHLRVTVKF